MLYIDMGSDALCDVCRIYPRFFKEANDYTIAGISLSCPEAARIILNDDSEKAIDHASFLKSDDDKVFFEIYNSLVKIITDKKFFDCDFEKLCDAADELVFNKAEFAPKLVDECFINETADYSPGFARLVAEAFPNLEYLTLELPDLIEQFKNLVKDTDKFKLYLPKADKLFGEIINSKESQNLAIYYLYKYMWEAIEDGDIELWVKRAYTMARLVCELYCFENADSTPINWQRYLRLAQLVSKEIEHNIDNLEIFENFCVAGM
jgi:lysine-N-methylase